MREAIACNQTISFAGIALESLQIDDMIYFYHVMDVLPPYDIEGRDRKEFFHVDCRVF